ncbi:MAG: SDR family NAD(P)-dependent oxidoreductase [Candidatus Fimadaptatus sp.]
MDILKLVPAYRTLAGVDEVNVSPELRTGARVIDAEDEQEALRQLSEAQAAGAGRIYVKGIGTLETASHVRMGRLANRIAIVTGSAQGFGAGIALNMLEEGASVVIADLNVELAQSYCRRLEDRFPGRTLPVKVDVSNEDSVRAMYEATVRRFGGLDILVNNAGVVKAGALDELTLAQFEFVTRVNYNAYFLCAKYAAVIMKAQREYSDEPYDIIQINSKSGLEGSSRNFAYSGSKFGGIGLTQSFAKELAPYGIKVNAICPGNYLDGPLWCDPEKGLFVQYLNAGKVPGAQTVEDVRRFYEAKVPLGRGCQPIDVARAIFYCVEQKYETGQAIPVTGGQNMLA